MVSINSAKVDSTTLQKRNGISDEEEEEPDAQVVAAKINNHYDETRESMRSWIPASYLQAFAKSGAKSGSSVKVSSDGVPLVRPARLGLGAEQAKPAKLSATEQKLQASVLRDKAKAASASAPKANGHSKQREDSSDDEDSRAGAIKSRANLASSRLDAFTKQKKKAKSDTPTPSIPVASTSKLPEVQSGMKITGIQSNGADTNDATVRSNKKRKRSSQEADTSKETRATQDEDSVLGFPPEPSDVDMNADESNTGPIKGPYRPPSDSDDDQDPSANISMNSIPSGHHDDSKLDSKQKKRKRAKQRRAERRKAARMSLGSQPDTLQ